MTFAWQSKPGARPPSPFLLLQKTKRGSALSDEPLSPEGAQEGHIPHPSSPFPRLWACWLGARGFLQRHRALQVLGTFSFKLFNLKLQPLKTPGVKAQKANFPSLIIEESHMLLIVVALWKLASLGAELASGTCLCLDFRSALSVTRLLVFLSRVHNNYFYSGLYLSPIYHSLGKITPVDAPLLV